MTKSKRTTKNSIERAAKLNSPEEERGKKRYLQRIIQEKEAEELIDDYLADECNPDRLDGLGLKRGQRRTC